MRFSTSVVATLGLATSTLAIPMTAAEAAASVKGPYAVMEGTPLVQALW